MANGGNDKSGSKSEVWDRLNKQSDLISELARSQAHTEAQLAALAQSVETGFSQITQSLGRVIERDSRPTNWFAAISALIVVAGAILTFNALQVDPVRRTALETEEQHQRAIEREMAYREEHGVTRSQIEALIKRVDTIEQFQHQSYYIHGKMEGLEKRVDMLEEHQH